MTTLFILRPLSTLHSAVQIARDLKQILQHTSLSAPSSPAHQLNEKLKAEKDGDPQQVSYDNIWQYHQNKAGIIIRDFERLGIPKLTTARILLARGVYKWFAARRQVIKLKNDMKAEISNCQLRMKTIKRNLFDHWEEGECKSQRQRHLQLAYERGFLAATEQWRNELRRICHSERWQTDLNDYDGSKAFYALERANWDQGQG